MKFLGFVVLAGFMALNAKASVSGATTKVSLFPAEVVSSSVVCTVSPETYDTSSRGACPLAITAGVSVTTSSFLLLLKEDIQQVEPDAYNFLAGEDMTLALADIIDQLREKAPELLEKSDEEMAVLLLETLSIN